MKNNLKFWLMAAAVVSLSLSFASCKPDDDLTPEEKAEKENAEKVAQASKFWDIVGQLVSMDDYTVNYADKKFEPTIGTPDNSVDFTRVVFVNSMEAAARSFAYIVGAEEDIDENTPTYTFKDKEVGTLTYTKVNDGSQWATVEVDIKQIPHLSKIIYRSPQQNDTNASFGGGTAYYRFGDVIYRTITAASGQQVKEYWVCVRPSFDPEGKGDSHWATVSPLPKEKVWEYKGSNGITYRLPQALGTSKEHMQNLAELLFAICSPEEWSNNVDANSTTGLFGGPSGLPIFHDFNIKNKKYHNQTFWEEVRIAWMLEAISEKVFGINHKDLEPLIHNSSSVGLQLLYNKAAWNTWFDNGPTFDEARYRNDAGMNSNCHKVNYYTYHTNVIDKKVPENNFEFDITQMITEKNTFISYKKFFGDDTRRYVVRFATGEELGGGRYNPQMPIAGFTELYRYNTIYGIEDLMAEPLVSGSAGTVVDDIAKQKRDEEYIGLPYYRLGNVYQDEEGSKWMVVWSAGMKDVDRSPFSYLISFDNIKSNGQRFTNLGPLDATIRGAYFLSFLSYQSYLPTSKDWDYTRDASKRVLNLNWENLFPMWWPVEKNQDARLGATTLCAPYHRSDTDTSQPLMRLQLNTVDWLENNIAVSVWTNYPTVFPDEQPDANSFSGIPIMLQDIADPNVVSAYANERVARMAIQYPKNQRTTVQRAIRTTTDERAKDLSKCIISPIGYNYFANPQPLLSIWNDPIVTYRATKIYDRGLSNHAITADNGAKLTLLKASNYWDEFDEMDSYLQHVSHSQKIGFMNLISSGYLNGENKLLDWKK